MSSPSPSRKRRIARADFVALLRNPYFWAIAARAAYFLVMNPITLEGDAADYHQVAANLAAGHGFARCMVPPYPPTAQRPPLFPILLAALYWLGASGFWASFLLNTFFDVLSVRLARSWATQTGFGGTGARRFEWIIALCPMLLAYNPYPTTENLSITLFLAASILTFRGGSRATALGGAFWGLLSLCRSYYLLFPFALLVFPPSRQWRRSRIALLAAFSLLAPSLWVARNVEAFGRPVFSQGAAMGWQAYQGLCFADFDWWNQDDVRRIFEHPVLSKMVSSYCVPDEEMASLDRIVREEVWEDCVVDRPLEAARNVAIKASMLFVNWGQLLPYTRIPAWIRWPVNAVMAWFWWCMVSALVRRRRSRVSSEAGASGAMAATRFAMTGILYVLAVTLPFAIDSRYLLGPLLLTAFLALEAAGSPGQLLRAGLTWPWGPSRRGSRTP